VNIEQFKAVFEVSPENENALVSLVQSMVSVGAFFGALLMILIGKRLGRRKLFIMGSMIVIAGSVLSMVKQMEVMVIGRFVYGFGAQGIFMVVTPKFIEETAPLRLKGQFGTLSQINLNGGVLTGYLLSFMMPEDQD